MLIYGLQKLSLLDFPEKLAATIFTGGCNLRCPFCHNASLVTHLPNDGRIPEVEVLGFLETRRGKLDGVCITGGEPLLQEGLEDFILKVREKGFLVKLDTNGCYPERLAAILARGIVDYVAMDVKNSFEKYPETVGIPGFDPTPVFESIRLLLDGSTPFEFRTTLVKPLHTEEDMDSIGAAVRGTKRYFLQSFEDSGDLVGFASGTAAGPLESFSAPELARFRARLAQYVDDVTLRN